MKIDIRGDNLKVTEEIKTQIESKLKKFDRYFTKPEEITAKVVVRTRTNEEVIEITIQTPKFTLRAETSHDELYAALNLTIDKLAKQMNKNKKKMHERYKEDIKLILEDEIEEETLKINKRKKLELKPMSEQEAILQLELIDHDFYIFKNIDTDSICVIYKRHGSSYGIIETENI